MTALGFTTPPGALPQPLSRNTMFGLGAGEILIPWSLRSCCSGLSSCRNPDDRWARPSGVQKRRRMTWKEDS